jgi:hypothetical protein
VTARMTALQMAIDLMQAPSRVRVARAKPLPEELELLLRIAARDAQAMSEAVRVSGRDKEFLRAAAMFFIEQILLGPQSDSYRTLGGEATTPTVDLRRNMALLLRSLHPDLEPQGDNAAAAWRVARAWNDVKTPERRAAYDAALAGAGASEIWRRRRTRRRRRRHIARVDVRRGFLLRALLFLLGRGGAAGGA